MKSFNKHPGANIIPALNPKTFLTLLSVFFLSSLILPFVAFAQSCQSPKRLSYSVPYLDDNNYSPLQPSLPQAKDPFKDRGYPHVWLSESESYPRPVGKAGLYRLQMLQHWSSPNVANTQSSFPDVMFYEQLTQNQYQGYNAPQFHPHIGNGPYFEKFGTASTGDFQSGWTLFAGHFLYRTGASITDNGISSSARRIHLSDNSNFKVGEQAVIRASKANFNPATTELISITAKGNDGRPFIDVTRGYKPSTTWSHPARSHSQGAWVSEILGTGATNRWAYNMSIVSPKDSQGRNAQQWVSWWHRRNFNKDAYGKVIPGLNIDGHFTDTDFYNIYTSIGSGKNLDCNNDGLVDNCHSSAGVNYYGEGMMDYYQSIRLNFPSDPYITGIFNARGFELVNGLQGEGGVAGVVEQFSGNPSWSYFPENLANFRFSAHFSQQPTAAHLVSSHPTKSWPVGGSPGSQGNEPVRLNLAMSSITKGGFAIRNHHDFTGPMPDEAVVYRGQPGISPTPSWGEAVNAGNGDAKNTSGSSPFDYADTRKSLGWMGKPLGAAWRILNEADWLPSKSLVNATFENGTDGWRVTNASLSLDSSKGTERTSRSLRVSRMTQFYPDPWRTALRGPSIQMTKDQWYTLIFWAWSDDLRQIQAGLGDARSQKSSLLVNSIPRLFILPFKAAASGSNQIRFNLGAESSNVWIDQLKVFNGNADLFRRDFEYGVWIANRGSTARTVQFGETLQRIKGKQDPTINNGAIISQDRIPPNAARFYIRRPGQEILCDGNSPVTTTTTTTSTTSTTTSTTTTSPNPGSSLSGSKVINGVTQTVQPERQIWSWFKTGSSGFHIVDVRWDSVQDLDVELVEKNSSTVIGRLSSSSSSNPSERGIFSLPAETEYYVKVYSRSRTNPTNFSVRVYRDQSPKLNGKFINNETTQVTARSQKWPWFKTNAAGFYFIQLSWLGEQNLDFTLTPNDSSTPIVEATSSSEGNSREFVKVYLPKNSYYNVRVKNLSNQTASFQLKVLPEP